MKIAALLKALSFPVTDEIRQAIAGNYPLGNAALDSDYALEGAILTIATKNGTSQPTVTLSAKLVVDSIKVDVTAIFDSDNSLVLSCGPAGSQPASILGTLSAFSDASASLQDEFKSLGVPFSSPQVDNFSILVDLSNGKPAIKSLLFVVSTGAWDVIQGLFRVEKLGVKIVVSQPLSASDRGYAVSFFGLLDVGSGSDVQLALHSEPPKTLLAELAHELDLATLLSKLMPNVQFPELALHQLELSIDEDEKSWQCKIAVATDWKPFDKFDFSLKGVSVSVDGQGSTPQSGSIGAIVDIGSAPFSVTSEHPGPDEGWEFSGKSTPDASISIGTFLEDIQHALGISTKPPQLISGATLSNLVLKFDTKTKDISFQADSKIVLIKDEPLEIGLEFSLTHKEADDDHTNPFYEIAFTGTIQFGEPGEDGTPAPTFALEFNDSEDEISMTGSWTDSDGGKLDLSDFAKTLGLEDRRGPPIKIDLGVNEAAFAWTVRLETKEEEGATGSANQKSFAVGANTTRGKAFFGAAKSEGSWGFVIGAAMNKDNFEKWIGSSLSTLDIFPLDDLCVLYSTQDAAQFELPELPLFTDAFPVIGAKPVDLKAGEMLLGIGVDLRDETNKHASLFKNLADTVSDASKGTAINELVFTLTLEKPLVPTVVTATLPGNVGLLGGITLSDVSAKVLLPVDGQEFGLSLSGSTIVPIDEKMLTATGRLSIDETEAEGGFEVTASNSASGGQVSLVSAPFGLKGVALSEVGAEVGVDFAPAQGLNLGLEGQFSIGKEPPAANKFAFVCEVVLDSTPIPLPDPLLFSLAMETLSVETAIVAATGKVDGAVPKFLRDITVTNLWIYWCQQRVMMPDGSMALPGFGFNGFIDLWGWKAHGVVSVGTASGASGALQIDPIDVLGGTISLKGTQLNGAPTPAVTLVAKEENGTWVSAKEQPTKQTPRKTFNPTKNLPVGYDNHTFVTAGGARLAFNSDHSPYLAADVDIWVLALKAGMHLDVTQHGFVFDFRVDIGTLMHAHLSCTLLDNNFSAESSFNLSINKSFTITLFKHDFHVDLDAGIDLEMSLSVGPDHLNMKLHGEFEFEGAHLTLPQFEINISSEEKKNGPNAKNKLNKWEDLPGIIIDQLVTDAEEIFGEILEELPKLVGEAAQVVAHTVAKADDAVKEITKQADEQADKALDSARKALAGADVDIDKAKTQADKDIDNIFGNKDREIAIVAKDAVAVVAAIAHEIDHVAAQAVADVEKIIDAATKAIAVIADTITQIAQDVAQTVKAIADAAVAVVKGIIDAAAEAVDEIGKTAEAVYDSLVDTAKEVWSGLQHVAKKVWDTVKHY